MTDLMKDFEKEFEKIKKDLKFKATLEDLDEIYFLRDYIQKEGYVGNKLSRQLARRISDVFVSWLQYLHGLVVVSPGNVINLVESQLFNDDEKAEINKIMEKIMAVSSKNSLITLTRDKNLEKEFFDDSVSVWKEINPKLVQFMERVGKEWEDRSKAKIEKKKKEKDVMYG
jgi:hypothetical protein